MKKHKTPQTHNALFVFENECGVWPVQMDVQHSTKNQVPISLELEISPTWKMSIPLTAEESKALRRDLLKAEKI